MHVDGWEGWGGAADRHWRVSKIEVDWRRGRRRRKEEDKREEEKVVEEEGNKQVYCINLLHNSSELSGQMCKLFHTQKSHTLQINKLFFTIKKKERNGKMSHSAQRSVWNVRLNVFSTQR